MIDLILCPNHPYGKILMAYDKKVNRFWVHCGDRKCNRWVQIDINKNGGVTATMMPKGHEFDFETRPTLVKGT